jgi:hypothetical protein
MATHRDSTVVTVETTKSRPALTCDVTEQDHVALTRLVILVPNQGINTYALSRRVKALATPCQLRVLFLGLGGYAGVDTSAHYRLATLGSMTRDQGVGVDVHVEPDDNWVRAVHRILQPGDAVICMAEQMITLRTCGRRALSQVIEYLLDVPVYVLTGMYVAERARGPQISARMSLVLQTLSHVAMLALVMSVLWALVRIDLATTGILRTGLLCVLGLVEVGLIGAWSAMVH